MVKQSGAWKFLSDHLRKQIGFVQIKMEGRSMRGRIDFG
jgi:hypothetical protein